MRIELHIDRLVLDPATATPHQAAAVGEAVRSELARLLAAAPAHSWQQARRQRRSGAPPAGPDGAVGLGGDIARSVYRAVRDGRGFPIRMAGGAAR